MLLGVCSVWPLHGRTVRHPHISHLIYQNHYVLHTHWGIHANARTVFIPDKLVIVMGAMVWIGPVLYDEAISYETIQKVNMSEHDRKCRARVQTVYTYTCVCLYDRAERERERESYR